MNTFRTSAFLCLSLAAASSFSQTLPSFSLKQASGTVTWTEKTLAAKPTLVILFSLGCPHNAKAAPHFNQLAKTLAGRVRVVGVVNAEGAEAASYQKKIGLDFPLICDPRMVLISAMGGRHSLDFFSLPGKGAKKAAGFWEGYSQGWVAEALKGIKVSVPASKLEFLPTGRQSGCGF